MSKSQKIPISVNAIKVCQRPQLLEKNPEFIKECDFFIFSINSDELLKIAKFLGRKESPLGVQREHKEDRDKEIGRFISSEHPFFPNTIIINIPIEFNEKLYDPKKGLLEFSIDRESAYIIDGQHRLKAFNSDYSNGVNLDLVVSAYFGLELPTIAEIFTRINFYQKPVSKSLVYDLLELNTDPAFHIYKDAHEIASILNDTIGSPFYGSIKMLGVGSGLISQASFVEAISTRYRIITLLDSFGFSLSHKLKLLDNYFLSANNSFQNNGFREKFIFSSSVMFNSLVKVFSIIIQTCRNKKEIMNLDFYKYTDVMADSVEDSDEIKSFGGFKGVKTLTDIFINALEEDGLI